MRYWTDGLFYKEPSVKLSKASVIGQVKADNDWSTEYEKAINHMKNMWVTNDTADFIAWKCYSTAKKPKHCIESVIWISNSESSLFQNCSNNNCMWLKLSGNLKWYDTLKLALDDWINRYNKNWFNNDSTTDWITRSHYCVWECSELSDWWSNWTNHFSSAVKELNI